MRKLVEVYQNSVTTKRYSLREVFVNPDYVVSLSPDDFTPKLLREGVMPDSLDTRQQFTRLTIHKGTSGQEMVVVGDVDSVRTKLYSAVKKHILKG